MGFIKSAMGDAVLTSLWVFALPFVGIFTAKISNFLGVETILPLTLLITTFVSSTNVIIFGLLGSILGGASFNPSTTVSFYAAGLKPDDSLMSMAARFPIQAAGGAAGALAISQVMPSEYKHRLKGPYLRVDLHAGAIAEGVVSFVFCFSLLCVMVKGPKNMILKVWLQSLNVNVSFNRFWIHRAFHKSSQCIWVGICEQLARFLGVVLRLLDLSIFWSNFGSFGFQASVLICCNQAEESMSSSSQDDLIFQLNFMFLLKKKKKFK